MRHGSGSRGSRRGAPPVEDLAAVARPALLVIVLLDLLWATVGEPRGTTPERWLVDALVLGAAAALLWHRHVLGSVLVVVATALAVTTGRADDALVLWLLVGFLAGLRGRSRAQVAALVGGAGFAIALGAGAVGGADVDSVGLGARLAVVVMVLLGIVLAHAAGHASARAVRRISASRARAVALLRQAQEIRETERRRLADELQALLTSGLAGLAELTRIDGSQTSWELREILDAADAQARSLLRQTRHLLAALRDGTEDVPEANDARVPGHSGVTRRVLTVVLALAGLERLLAIGSEGLSEETVVQAAACAALMVLVWRRRPGLVLCCLVLLLALVSATLGAPVGGWTVVITFVLAAMAVHAPRWTGPALAALAVYLALVMVVGLGIGVPDLGAANFLFALVGGLAGAARRLMRRDESAALEEFRRSRSARERAADEEREHLARELHDVVAFQLSTASMAILGVDGAMDRDELAEAVEQVAESVQSARWELEAMVQGLRRADAAEAPEALVTASTMGVRLAQELQRAGFAPSFALDPAADALEPAQLRTIVRAMQEGASNILRYATPCSPCEFELRVGAGSARLAIRSALRAGEGARTVHALSNGLGLRGIQERTELLGGSFASGPAGGHWHVRVQLPVAEGANFRPRIVADGAGASPEGVGMGQSRRVAPPVPER